MSNVTLAEEHRRCDRLSTCFYHSLAPTGAWRRFLLFSLITSLILLLIAPSRSSMFWPILDLDLIKDLRRGVTHAGSGDEMQTVLNGMHLSMCLWIRVSKLFTASSGSFVPGTLSQVAPASSKYNASFRCFLQSRMRIFWRTGLSFDSAGKTTAVWSIYIGIENGAHFPNKSGRFVRTLSKYATPFVGKFTREFHLVNWQSSFTSSLVASPAKQWSIQGVDLRACLHEGGGPKVGEVTRLGAVTRLSI